jgi:hypothetical protein
MSHRPLLLAGDLFALETYPESPMGNIGVVIALSMPMAGHPLAVKIARRLAGDGRPSVIVDRPGVGENRGLQASLEEALRANTAAVAHLYRERCDSVVLVADADSLQAALGVDHDSVLGIASAAIPSPDPVESIAANVGASDYLRRGMSMSMMRGLLDPTRRRRYVELLRAKTRHVLRSRHPTGGPGGDPGHDTVDSQLATTLARGRRVLLLAGVEDRTTRRIRELQVILSDSRSGAGLDTDTSFPRRLGRFDSVAAQDWFTDSVVDWVARSEQS